MKTITILNKIDLYSTLRKMIKQLFLFSILLYIPILAQSADRGRVKIMNGTVVGDNSKPLRFCHLEFGITTANTDPSKEPDWSKTYAATRTAQWDNIKNHGINGVRMVIWRMDESTRPDGSAYFTWLDKYVDWASERGMYLVIDYHHKPGDKPNWTDWVKFWEDVAPRYKDRTNVIFEAANEPVGWLPSQYSAADRVLQENMFEQLRAWAPNTHLIMWSYANLDNSTGAINNSIATPKIKYTNASIGFHWYKASKKAVQGVQAAGYPLICTEFTGEYGSDPAGATTDERKANIIKECETFGLSWMVWAMQRPSSNFVEIVETYNVTWCPDFGTWPLNSATCNTSNIPPSVSITVPANNASFNLGTNITISATATDSDGSIAKVEFYSGTTKIGEDNSSPYSITWTPTVTGNFSITAKAFDNLQASKISTAISVSITGNNLPVVSIQSPTNGSSVVLGSTIVISANATDSDGSINKVEFYNGTTKLGEDNSIPYSFSWTPSSTGTFNITAKAFDNLSASKVSSSISISVTPIGNIPPTVSINAPINGTSIEYGTTIEITAIASDSDGSITNVEFYADSLKLGEDNSSPYSFSWTALTSGYINLRAKAFDNTNASTLSNSITINVGNERITPNNIVYAINANGPKYINSEGITFQADKYFIGGNKGTNTGTITGTNDPTIYNTVRYNNFSYVLPISNGDYDVTLMFVEDYWSLASKRIFDVKIENIEVISNLDIFNQVGKFAAFNQTKRVKVIDDTLNLNFINNTTNAATVAGIIVESVKVELPTSIEKSDNKFTSKIYPIPTSGELNIIGASNSEIVITDLLGRNVWQTNIHGEQINISNLKPGRYILQIVNLLGVETRIIIKE